MLLVGYQPTGAVGYISYNMGTFDLLTRAHVITIT